MCLFFLYFKTWRPLVHSLKFSAQCRSFLRGFEKNGVGPFSTGAKSGGGFSCRAFLCMAFLRTQHSMLLNLFFEFQERKVTVNYGNWISCHKTWMECHTLVIIKLVTLIKTTHWFPENQSVPIKQQLATELAYLTERLHFIDTSIDQYLVLLQA